MEAGQHQLGISKVSRRNMSRRNCHEMKTVCGDGTDLAHGGQPIACMNTSDL